MIVRQGSQLDLSRRSELWLGVDSELRLESGSNLRLGRRAAIEIRGKCILRLQSGTQLELFDNSLLILICPPERRFRVTYARSTVSLAEYSRTIVDFRVSRRPGVRFRNLKNSPLYAVGPCNSERLLRYGRC